MSKLSENQVSPQISFSAHELGNFDLLVEGIFKILTDHFGFIQTSIALHTKNSHALKFVRNTSHPLVDALLNRFLGQSMFDLNFPLANKENLLTKAYVNQKVYVSESLQELASPVVSQKVTFLIEKAIRLKYFIVIPILNQGKSIGVIAVGSRENEPPTEKENKLLLELSAQVGRYINKLWSFENSPSNEGQTSQQQLLSLDKDFLKNVHTLLSELAEIKDLGGKSSEDIEEYINYLQSLVLIHETYE